MQRFIPHIVLFAALLATTACSSSDSDEKKAQAKPVASGNLTRNLELIDSRDGLRYGNVELTPVGGGRVFDADGRLIGHIVPPAPVSYAPAPAYAPPPPPPAGYVPAQ